jgi:site-specific recombinase XerD
MLESDFRPVTPESIKKKLLGIDEQNYYFLVVFKDHNEKLKLLGDKEVAPATITRYETAYKHLKEFIKHQYKKDDCLFRDVNYNFIKNFEFYMKIKQKCAHNTTVKYIVNIKKIIRIAMANHWTKQDPFKDIRYRYDDVDAVYLNDDFLTALVTKEIKVTWIDQVREPFEALAVCLFPGTKRRARV